MNNTSVPKPQPDAGNINKVLYDSTKRYWTGSMAIKIAAVFAGILTTTLVVPPPESLPFIVAAAAFLAEMFQLRSDNLKGRAEAFRRKIEYRDGFGWGIEGAEIADVLAGMTARKRAMIAKKASEAYYASSKSPGPARVLENLRESAWWSKHLSSSMRTGCAVVLTVTVAGSIAALYIAAISLPALSDRQNVVRIATATLSLIVSVGLWRFLVGYSGFNLKAERYEKAAADTLKGASEEIAALKLLHDYQIARASAPIIPDWLWKLRRDGLNELWNAHCKADTGSSGKPIG